MSIAKLASRSVALLIILLALCGSCFAVSQDELVAKYGKNLIDNADFVKGLNGWDAGLASIDKNLKPGAACVKLTDDSLTERMRLQYALPKLPEHLALGKDVYAEAWYYIDSEPKNSEYGITTIGLGPAYDLALCLLPSGKILLRGFDGKAWISTSAGEKYPLKQWFKLGIRYNLKALSGRAYLNDKLIGTVRQNFMSKPPSRLVLAATYPDGNTGVIYVANVFCGIADVKEAEKISIAAVDYARFDRSGGSNPKMLTVEKAFHGKMLVVGASGTKTPAWVEYDFLVKKPGTYELYVYSGGNNSPQAAFVSIDGSKEYLPVEDKKAAENEITPGYIAAVDLKAGKHTVRVIHHRADGFSSAFALDRIEFRCTEDN